MAASLVREQRSLGHESELGTLMNSDLSGQPWKHPTLTLRAAADRWLVAEPNKSAFFSFYRNGFHSNMQFSASDVVNLHWMNGVLNADQLESVVGLNPGRVFWTLHDMAPFTGGCHYAEDCNAFESTCNQCPQVRSLFVKPVRRALETKLEHAPVYSEITYVAPSPWMRDMAQASALLRDARVEVILNPINRTFFSAQSRANARKQLGIEEHRLVGMIIAADLSDPRKGVRQALTALSATRATGVELDVLLVGGQGDRLAHDFPFVRMLGSLDPEALAQIGAASDFLVVMSVADNAPLVIGEAGAMGVPTFVRSGTGASQLVRDGKTGIIVDSMDDLASAVTRVSQHREWLAEMGNNAQSSARENHEPGIVAQKYLTLYASA